MQFLTCKKKNITLRSPTKRGGRSNFAPIPMLSASASTHQDLLKIKQLTFIEVPVATHPSSNNCTNCFHPSTPPLALLRAPVSRLASDWIIGYKLDSFGTACSSSFQKQSLQTLKKRHPEDATSNPNWMHSVQHFGPSLACGA